MENHITESISWVGVHFPEPAPGASLNAFLIRDEKIAVIDTGAPATAGLVVSNIKSQLDPASIDYVILTHTDLDHAGGLSALLAEAPQATVITSPAEAGALGMWGVQAKTSTVEDDDTLSLGQHRLRFVSAPFSCNPGTLMVFEETEGVLFSADLFVTMGPSQWQVFADTDKTEALKMGQRFKLGNTQHTRSALEKVSVLPVKIIASGHGQMINTGITGYLDSLLAEAG